MREKWNKTDGSKHKEGQPVPQRITLFPETTYQPKISKAPSMQAISNYYNLATDNELATYDNLSFIPEDDGAGSRYDVPYTISDRTNNDYYNYGSNASTLNKDISLGMFRNETPASRPEDYDYAQFGTMGSSSVRTYTSAGSDMDFERRDELGSTSQLVPLKVKSTCCTLLSHIESLLCTISLAAGFGNLYRLPQNVLIRGELPFLVAYVILSLLVGFPLLFLELGIGQLAQEGFIKMWRAVPFFKGVGYIKLVATCFLILYYPLYIALCLYYTIWVAKGPLPFSECSVVRMEETGYRADGIKGEQCLDKTFLESPYTAPKWFGIFTGLLLFIWAVIVLLSFQKTKSFMRSLVMLFFPTVGCLIALVIHAIIYENSFVGLDKLVANIDWSVLEFANVWYYAVIQVFFSTNIGFGTFVTSAGVIYNKTNPLGLALLYTIFNIFFGAGSVLFFYSFSENIDVTLGNDSTAELHLLSVIYNSALQNLDQTNIHIWLALVYLLLLFAGLLSMVTLIYTLLKVIEFEIKQTMSWWQTTIIVGILGFVVGAAILLCPDFKLVHLLDHYVVGNLILIAVVTEVFALLLFYGTKRLQCDFEFIVGRTLSKLWYAIWWSIPLVILGVFIWALATVQLNGITKVDPEWLYGTGWAIVFMAIVFILAAGIYTTTKQEEYYSFGDKLKAALKPSRKWGPVDPILRYSWVHWHSKAKEGERDFTLKRRGTKDYTHSIKKYNNPKGKSYTQTASELSTASGSAVYHKNDQNQNNIRLSNGSTTYAEPYVTTRNSGGLNGPFQVTSLVDSFDPPVIQMYGSENGRSPYKTSLNPLARLNGFNDLHVDSSNSEGYGTFRKGPYIINDDSGHVCHRKYSHSEEATEL